MAAAQAASLRDINIRQFRLGEISEPVVIFVHSPREQGTTTLIGSILMELQASSGLDGVFVLTDRGNKYYMGGILPDHVILDKPLDFVLRKLIEVQRHRQSTLPDKAPLKLAVAVDDFLYTARDLKQAALQRDIKLAKAYNISIVVATSDASVLPANAHTLATHGMATKCLSTDEPKLLKKSMFVMYDSPVALADTLALCASREFLVGLLRFSAGSQATTMLDYSRAYRPTFYARNEVFATQDGLYDADRWEEGTLRMEPEHVSLLTQALRLGTDMK